jgi:ABC-type antimicrobial peptide transport system ATPase subunit
VLIPLYFDWTYKNVVNVTSGDFFLMHFLFYKAARMAGKMHVTQDSLYFDYSSKDLHFSTIESNPKTVNSKNKIGNRYAGLSVPDKFMDDFLHEFLRRRKVLDLRKFLGLFPDFDGYLPMLKMGSLEMLMPELAD